MSEFNENNNLNGITENASVEPVTTEPTVEDTTGVSFPEGPEIIGGVEAAKKNKTKIIAIIVAAVVLIFGCCAGAYAAIPQFKNTVKMLVNSPEEYYKWVENQNTENNVEFLSALFYSNNNEKSSGANMQIKAELESVGIDKLFEENKGKSFTDVMSEAGLTLPSSFNMNIKSTKIDGYLAVNEEMSADGNPLIKLNAYSKDNKYYLQYPELSSSYICVDYLDFIEKSLETRMTNENEQGAQIFKSIVDTMTGKSDFEPISRNDFEDIFNRYFKVMIDSVNNVEISKNTECEADGVKGEYTKLTAKFDQGTLFSALKGVLKELQDDDVVAGLVEDFSGISKDEYKNAVDQALKSIGGLEMSGGDTIFVMNVYVNSKGEIVGRNIEDADQSGEFSVGYICTNNSNNYGFSFYFEADGDRVSFDGNAAESSGKLTGSAKISSTEPLDGNAAGADETNDIIGVSFENLEIKDEFLKGSLTVALGSLGLDDLTLNFDEKDGNQTCNFDFTYEGTKIGTFTIEVNNETPDSITVFNNDAKIYDAMTEMEQYSSEIDYEGFIKNICKAFGIDENSIPSEFYDMDLANSFGNKYAIDDFDIDEDEFDDDFDDIEFEDYSVEYDFNKLKIQYNGNDIKLPGKVEGILDKVKFEPENIEAKGYAYGYSDDYNISASIYNPSEKEAKAKDCNIYSLSIINESNEKLTVDGIGFGDDIKKVVDKYGYNNLKDQKSGAVELSDSSGGFGYVSFLYYDGKVTGITLYFDAV